MSSANDDKNDDATVLSMSPMRTRKSSGPNTDPCGTPEVTGLVWDFFPSTITDWTLLVKKEQCWLRSVTWLVEYASTDPLCLNKVTLFYGITSCT